MTPTSEGTKKAIQFQEIVGEVYLAGYNLVRLSRVKYKENPYTFIDGRVFAENRLALSAGRHIALDAARGSGTMDTG